MTSSRADNPLSRTDQLVASHAAAEQVLRDFEEKRAPYVLYLRKFDIHVIHGPEDGNREFAEDTLMDDLPDGAGLLGILDIGDGQGDMRQAIGRAPALWLGDDDDDEWQAIVEPIIRHAELIVSEFAFLSSGVRWELDKCREFGKELQTVLILPPPGCEFAPLDHLEPLDQFPRVAWANQLFEERLSKSFAIADLVKRVHRIAKMPVDERFEAYANRDMTTRVPVSSQALWDGYKDRLREWQGCMSFDEPDAALLYVCFWDWFRLLCVGWCLHRVENIPLDELVFDLTNAQIEILQGIAHGAGPADTSGSFLTDEFEMKLATTVYSLIRRYPQQAGILEDYARRTFERLNFECDWED